MAITGNVGMIWDVKDVRSSDLESGSIGISRNFLWPVTSGTGLDQADRMFQDIRILTTGATEDLDLSGTLANLYGTVTFAKLKAFGIFADELNTTNITVSRPAGATGVPIFAAISDALAPLKPGCGFMYWDRSLAGITVTAGTGDLITITNSAGASATYYVFILGTSA